MTGPKRSHRHGARPLVLTLVTVLTATVALVAPGSERIVHAAVQLQRDATGPLGPITVIGDSVLVGAGTYGPTLPDRLVEQGWGPVRFRAGEGYSTGAFPVPLEFRATYWLAQWRAQGWETRDVIVNLGANDSGFCGTDLGCARAAILHVVDAIGPGHRIWWPMITRLYTHAAQQDTWNTALAQLAAERPELHTWDWPTEMASGGYPSNDGTHLSPDGYRRRSQRMAEEATAALAVAERTGADAALPPALGEPSTYVPLTPTRVLDTRHQPPGRLPAGGTVTLDLGAAVPPGTVAVAANLTAAGPGGDGYLTAHPCDRPRREVSSVNHRAGEDRGALAVIPLSADGTLCVFSFAPADVIVDLQGAFVATGATSSRFTPLASPERLLDTRATGRSAELRVSAPPGATAVAVNLTATGAAAGGYLSAAACGAPTSVSNVNFGVSEPVAGSAFVPVGPDGTFCVWASTSVDVIVDITGTFSPTGALAFVPADPTRTIDTRNGIGGWSPVHGRGQTIDARVAPPGAAAVTGTITIVGPIGVGFLTAFGCATPPPTSAVNAEDRRTLANALTVGVSNEGRMCVTASTVTHSLFDTTGWWVA